MNDAREGALGAGPAHWLIEVGVALATAVFGLIVIAGSYRVGMGWDADGPRAGFFPFYVGVIILGASCANLVNAWGARTDRVFADWSQLRQVLSVVVPMAIYVCLVPWIGIYVSSALLIGLFMRWIGRYGWLMVALVAVGTPIATFMTFERWFLVPLPKGPVEAMLGF
jgi:hypothetical protein